MSAYGDSSLGRLYRCTSKIWLLHGGNNNGAYSDNNGVYMHAELNAYGQILAISEASDNIAVGYTMMFCFHFGEGGEKQIQTAYDVLKEEAISCTPIAPCGYSSWQFVVTDKFGVYWCLFV